MPGIAGYITEPGERTDGLLLASMLDTLRHEDWHRVESYVDSNAQFAAGRVSLGFVNTAPQPAILPEHSLVAVMDGELYRPEQYRAEVERAGHRCEGASHAEILLRIYRSRGRAAFAQLDGKFTAAIYDGERQRIILVNDRFGMRPCYYAVGQNDKFLFASGIKSLLLDSQVSSRQNHRGIVQFFAFGHLWGEETLYEAIRALPPAAWVEFDIRTRELRVERYWTLPTPTALQSRPEELLDRIDVCFERSVRARVEATDQLGLSLSGGLDARTILGVIDHDQVRVKALCLGMEGSRDQLSARQMASIVGCEYHDFLLDARFLTDFGSHLDRMVQLTDGHYLSQCIVMPTLPRYRELGIEVLLRGHAGELMHMQKAYNFSLDREGLAIDSESQLHDWLYRHLRSYMLEGLDQPLFAFADENETEQIARDAIRAGMDETREWPRQLDRIWPLFVRERLRRETAMSLVKFGSVVETRLPYLDSDLVESLLAAPAELKLDEEIQEFILRRHRPEFLDVTNVNTGARIGAGPLVRKLQYGKMRVLSKLGAPGYQPYERLGLWLRRELRPLVENLLLNDQCLQRGTLRADAVRTAVNEHLTEKRNHTYLLMAMMIYETGQRQLSREHAVAAI